MEYYVYKLIDSRNNQVFYIGKGQKKRMYHHVDEVQRGRIPNRTNIKLGNKIKKILSSGHKVKYEKVFITKIEHEAFDREIKLIKEIGLENLCNLTEGGSAGTGMTGRNHSNESKRKISENNVGMLGKRHSEETKKKISESNKGKKFSEGTRKKLSVSHKGKKHSKETKIKMSENNARYWLGKRRPEKTRKKMSKSHKGHVGYWNGKNFSEEHKKNISKSKKIIK